MKRRLLLLIGCATLLSTGSGTDLLKSNELSNEFTYSTFLDSKEVIGNTRKFLPIVEDITDVDFTTGNSTFVSPTYSQVSESGDSIRYVAALKGDILEDNSITVKGNAGFHIRYTKNGQLIDKHLQVQNYYYSMKAGNTWYYANDLSQYKGQDGILSVNDFLAPKSFVNQDYNLFIALDINGIDETNRDTLIEIQPYYVTEEGTRSYAQYSKVTSAVGYESKFVVVNGERTLLTKTGDDYKVENLKLKKDDTVQIVDSYGIPVTNFGGAALVNGQYVAPRNGTYDFTLSNSVVSVYKRLTGVTVSLDGYDSSKVPAALEETAIGLPSVKVEDVDNGYTTDNVNIEIKDLTDSKATIKNGKLTSTKAGVHEIKYIVTDKETNEVISEQIINVKVYLKIYREAGTTASSHITLVGEESDNPHFNITDKQFFVMSFNFKESKNYYAEFEMSKVKLNNDTDQVIGFAHNKPSPNNDKMNVGTYYEGIKFNKGKDGGIERATSKYCWDWGHISTKRMWASQTLINGKSNTPNIDPINKETKVAIARVGDNFYYFYNDVLISVNQYPEYLNIGTVPGITIYAGENIAPIDANFSKFNFIKEEADVKNKVDSLMNTNSIFDYYDAWTGEGNLYPSQFDNATFNGNGFSYKNEEVNIGNDDKKGNNSFNRTMVAANYNLFGTSWQVDFDMRVDCLGDNNNWGKLILDLRTVHDRKTVFDLHNTFGNSRTLYELITNSCEVGSASNISHNQNHFNRDMDLHYTIKLVSTDHTDTSKDNDGYYQYYEKYEIIISDKNNPSVSITINQTITYNTDLAYDASYASSPKILVFKSQKFAGTISNFQVK